jgi:hypothetical protein
MPRRHYTLTPYTLGLLPPQATNNEAMEGSINSEGLPNKGIDYYIAEDLVAAVKGEKGIRLHRLP